jgi:acyl carrier protein
METLVQELKTKIIETLELVDVKEQDIGDREPLVGGDLGIDSIDVLELVIMIEKDYGVLIDNKELGQKVFQTITTLAEHIHQNRAEAAS